MDITVAEKIRLIMKRQNKTMGDIAEASGRGTFYERNEGGRVEFWSDIHPGSRIYDENERVNSAAPAQIRLSIPLLCRTDTRGQG